MSSQLALNTTEHLSKLTLEQPHDSTEVAAIQRRINENVAARKVQEDMNRRFAEVVINSTYLNLRSVILQQMKETEKTCLELALERLNVGMVKKDLYLEKRKLELNQQLAEVHTLEKEIETRCERLDQENAEIKARTANAETTHKGVAARVLEKERQRDVLLE